MGRPPRDPPRVVLACAGLDHAFRGFESFARECYETLRAEPGLELTLVKGSGPARPGERRALTLRRDTALARRLAKALERPPFVVEHVTFSLGLVPQVARLRPDLVYFSEWHVGQALARWRSLSRQPFRLLFNNGASAPGPYDGLDHVQQLSPSALEWVVARGVSPENQSVLPLAVHVDPALRVRSAGERRALRARLGLPPDRRIVISVAALNRQKRLDYLIEEVAALPDPRPFLLMVGAEEDETPPLRAHAAELLGADGYAMRSVPREQVAELLEASDVFVLASLWEGLPLALIEAMSHGLPCVAHDYPTTAFVLADHGHRTDLRESGAVSRALTAIEPDGPDPELARRRHAHAYERFSWDRLAPAYVELLRRCSRG